MDGVVCERSTERNCIGFGVAGRRLVNSVLGYHLEGHSIWSFCYYLGITLGRVRRKTLGTLGIVTPRARQH